MRGAEDFALFLTAVEQGTEQARLGLERVEARWGRAAGGSAADRRRAALAAHLAATPATSAARAAAALGVSGRTAERLIVGSTL